jgi:hypothetical protein
VKEMSLTVQAKQHAHANIKKDAGSSEKAKPDLTMIYG